MEFHEKKNEKDGQRRKRFLKFLREDIPAQMKRQVEEEEKKHGNGETKD